MSPDANSKRTSSVHASRDTLAVCTSETSGPCALSRLTVDARIPHVPATASLFRDCRNRGDASDDPRQLATSSATRRTNGTARRAIPALLTLLLVAVASSGFAATVGKAAIARGRR